MKRYSEAAGTEGSVIESTDGEYVLYEDHVEAMKRIAGDSTEPRAAFDAWGGADYDEYVHGRMLQAWLAACAWMAQQAQQAEPVAYVNSDELDNMLDDRTATIAGVRDGWRGKPLYAAAPEPSAARANEAGRLRAALYAIANTYDDHELRQKAREAYDAPIAAPAPSASPADQVGWIPVSERFPPRNQDVILALTTGAVLVGFYYGQSMGWDWPETDADEDADAAVTHWMSMPAAPQSMSATPPAAE